MKKIKRLLHKMEKQSFSHEKIETIQSKNNLWYNFGNGVELIFLIKEWIKLLFSAFMSSGVSPI